MIKYMVVTTESFMSVTVSKSRRARAHNSYVFCFDDITFIARAKSNLFIPSTFVFLLDYQLNDSTIVGFNFYFLEIL